jgi:RNA polymerase sigma-70 factor (ECF subfamily)
LRSPESVADTELLQRAAVGDPAALVALYDAFAPRVFGLALLVTRDHDAAAQITYETFRWLAEGKADSPVTALPGVLAHAHQLAVRLRRARRALQSTPPSQSGERARTTWTGSSAIQTLAPDEQRILGLVYFDGHTVAGAALQLSMPETAARSTLTRAMRSLASATKQKGGSE